ncbi:MAG: hypothetical protein ABSA46_00785 [Thermodesulfovibrionales bacterium]|jgi:ribonucleoside-diphosphate reductase alpha chain
MTPEDHIEMQAAFQEYTDAAASKTINLPHRAKKEGVYRAFLPADDKALKRITVFKYGSAKGTLASDMPNLIEFYPQPSFDSRHSLIL